jgi:FAD binding domain in molybdopterin dehydrogenase
LIRPKNRLEQAPSQLVDIKKIDLLRYISEDGRGGVEIGAATKPAELAESALLRDKYPMLVEAVNKGLIVGAAQRFDAGEKRRLPAMPPRRSYLSTPARDLQRHRESKSCRSNNCCRATCWWTAESSLMSCGSTRFSRRWSSLRRSPACGPRSEWR